MGQHSSVIRFSFAPGSLSSKYEAPGVENGVAASGIKPRSKGPLGPRQGIAW